MYEHVSVKTEIVLRYFLNNDPEQKKNRNHILKLFLVYIPVDIFFVCRYLVYVDCQKRRRPN